MAISYKIHGNLFFKKDEKKQALCAKSGVVLTSAIKTG